MINNFVKYNFPNKEIFFTFVILIFPFCVIIGSAAINFYFIGCSFLFFVFSTKKEIVSNFQNNWLKIFLFIIIYLCFISFFAENIFNALKSAISQFRFLFFILFCVYLSKYKFLINKYFQWTTFLILFVSLDGVYQFLNGKNLFGFSKDPQNPDRLGGVFDQELILGSFIFLSCIPVISLMLSEFKTVNIKKKIFYIFFIFICFLTILLSGERMSFLLFCISLISLSLFYFSLKKALFLFIILLTLISGFITFNKSTSARAHNFYNEISLLKNQSHIRLFSSAVSIWRENIFFGVGLKNYRVKCDINEYDHFTKREKLCSTHPHNYYFEILAETGLIGLLMFLTFFSFLVKMIISNYKKIEEKLKPIYLGSSLIIMIFIWPIKSTGSFFSTFTASFFWFNIGIVYYFILKTRQKNK